MGIGDFFARDVGDFNDNETDARLIQQALTGDERAFSRICALYRRLLLGICQRYAATKEDAEDLVQETFTEVFRRLGEYEERGRFRSWLVSTACNVGRTHATRARRRADLAIRHDKGRPSELVTNALVVAVDREIGDAIQACIDRLLDLQRLCFALFYIHDYSYADIADILGLGTTQVRGRLDRARNSVRECLKRLGITPS